MSMRGVGWRLGVGALVALATLSPHHLAAQNHPPYRAATHRTFPVPSVRPAPLIPQDTSGTPFGSEFLVPFGSLFLPGLGQYTQGAGWAGLGYTATMVAGAVATGAGDPSFDAYPRDPGDQLAVEGLHVVFSAGALSAWDAFRRSLPGHQRVGRYRFLEGRDGLGDLLTAPFDFRFLGRWTTWADLAFTALVVGVATASEDRDPDAEYEPFRAHDAAFLTSFSYNAAVAEEALFRGWLLPMLHQKLGERFWAANVIQAALFGAGHPQAEWFALVIGGGAVYSGWLTRRNGWSVREPIFHHFWYDVAVLTAGLLTDEVEAIRLPTLSIRF